MAPPSPHPTDYVAPTPSKDGRQPLVEGAAVEGGEELVGAVARHPDPANGTVELGAKGDRVPGGARRRDRDSAASATIEHRAVGRWQRRPEGGGGHVGRAFAGQCPG